MLCLDDAMEDQELQAEVEDSCLELPEEDSCLDLTATEVCCCTEEEEGEGEEVLSPGPGGESSPVLQLLLLPLFTLPSAVSTLGSSSASVSVSSEASLSPSPRDNRPRNTRYYGQLRILTVCNIL